MLGAANLTIFTTGEVNTRSLAGFADFSYSITDQWRLSLGARYTSDRREGTVYRQNFTGIRSPFFGNNAAVPGLVRTDYTNTRTDEQFTPRVSLSYLPTPDVTVYAAYSRGYKSGGFDMRGDAFLTPQTVNGYDPETVDAYEVGLKAYALQRALYFGIAAFYSDYRNQQVTTQVVAPGPSVASFVDNVGDSRISGIEFEARATVSPNISVAGMASYINADFKRFLTFDLATNQFIDVADQRVFQNTPQFTFMVAPTFTHGLGGGTVSVHAVRLLPLGLFAVRDPQPDPRRGRLHPGRRRFGLDLGQPALPDLGGGPQHHRFALPDRRATASRAPCSAIRSSPSMARRGPLH